SAVPVTRTRALFRSMSMPCTPASGRSASSTCRAQLPQVMPSTFSSTAVMEVPQGRVPARIFILAIVARSSGGGVEDGSQSAAARNIWACSPSCRHVRAGMIRLPVRHGAPSMSTKESVRPDTWWQVFKVFLRLGLTSFGGPLAHLGYFHAEFVRRRQWLSERSYADLVALCQFLPGPASSQVGIAIGLARAGHGGALAAWAGFTLPSALLLILFALGLSAWGDLLPPGLVHGLKVVAVAVVAQAVWGMARVFCTSARGLALMLGAAAVLLFWASPLAQVSVILLAGLLGLWLFTAEPADAHQPLSVPPGRGVALALLGLFFLLLLGLPLLAQLWPVPWLERVDAFYRAGSLVFGGGHVVLPLLQSEVVGTGWVSNETFLAGYGATQAVPGPLF